MGTRRADWSDPGAAEALLWLAIDDLKGNPKRPVSLPSSVYTNVIASFLRFDAPLPNQLYVLGGRNQQDGPLDSVEMFDSWHGCWVTCPPMSVKRAGCGAAELPDRRLLCVGGYDGEGIVRGLLASCEIFDPVTQQWSGRLRFWLLGILRASGGQSVPRLAAGGAAGMADGAMGENVPHITETSIRQNSTEACFPNPKANIGRQDAIMSWTVHIAILAVDSTTLRIQLRSRVKGHCFRSKCPVWAAVVRTAFTARMDLALGRAQGHSAQCYARVTAACIAPVGQVGVPNIDVGTVDLSHPFGAQYCPPRVQKKNPDAASMVQVMYGILQERILTPGEVPVFVEGAITLAICTRVAAVASVKGDGKGKACASYVDAADGRLAGIGQILIVLYGSAWGQPVPDFGTHRADLQATVRMRSAIVSVAIILFCCILVSQEHRVVSSDEGEEEDDKAQKEAEDNDAFTSTLRKVSPEELGSHNEMGDLWMSVGGVVCDLSDFISVHPGGVELLMQHAGQEATDAFTEIGHSSFALKMIRERAIGVLDSNAEADEPRGVLQVPEAPSLLGRMFTKEDPYHFHKFLGISIVVQFLVRSGIVMNGEFMEGKDIAWFGPDYFSLACIWVSALLQFSSFKFHVPKNRILGAPMIWQEWRAHNAVFVLRHVIGCTIKWYAWHNQIVDGPMYHLLNVAMFATLVWQLWSVDVITAWLSEDKHESLTATYPFWRGCPSWVESFIKFWYTIAQFMASSLLVSMEPQSLAISYLVIFPFQWASFLMTLVRKGAITTRSYHVGYLWSLMQVVALGMLANSPGVWVTHFSLWAKVCLG
ncbi:unnamed protein product [Polarella glacialis]|uniref:Cytochrome b5 heme-binding domain-containing protein n=2 Tax=Polarella glacialis TaxID=89957 RepID=A0A813FDH4_POLGL|nr:unnamed protein product [Polarella glacialis]